MKYVRTLICFLLTAMSSVTIASESPEKLIEEHFEYLKSNATWKACKLYRNQDLRHLKEGLMTALLDAPSAEKQDATVLIFGEEASFDGIKKMSDIQFCESILQFAMQQTASPEVLELLRLTIIGKVMEGEHTAHVVARYFVELTDVPSQNVEVATVVKEGNTWKMTMPEAIASMGELFQQGMTQSK
ncbi:hypothetical protein [Pseudoalteromonas rubra]|uniref:SnoaL-like domain-containing protein n=1 Tax=Pseudoalteromonas rubra TaxID=43658 RepID=A0A0F4QA15_9GAMM|nr:hypothetical protein [Pseudoalteromonas rubra]KJZ04468.1 hypothetical protein TW77_23495 [Pseudoalteromonas rubra]